MAQTPRIVDIEKVVHGNKVKTNFISAPFTQITNEQGEPRKIPDLANNLKPSLGIERIMSYGPRLVTNEFGPNNESVFENTDSDPRIRFVGRWDGPSESAGTRTQMVSGDTTSFIEVTFYGTGLNLLTILNTSIEDHRVSVDGGPEGANIVSGTWADPTNGRNYKNNQVLPIVSGLSLGIHTVKIRNNTNSEQIIVHGLEIVNESAQLVINPGQPFVGGKSYSLTTQQLLDIKPSEIVGTKGARVVTYLDSDGNIGRSIQEVEATAQYIDSTNHSNEEVIRKINFQEFGRNRADDFSTVSGFSNRAFVLDDGTTTLAAQDISSIGGAVTGESVLFIDDGTSNFYTLTFVGTGLDLIRENQDANVRDDQVFVNGVDVGSIALAANELKRQKICSDLPYGTHTIKIQNNSGILNGGHVKDFIIYGPKKPELPDNVVELADYNIMADADFSSINETGLDGFLQTPTGSLRKSASREFLYEDGTTNYTNVTLNPAYGLGIATDNVPNGESYSFTFFGTGFSTLHRASTTGASNFNIEIDGVLDDSGVALTNTINNGGGNYTGNGGGNEPQRIKFEGLSLGFHTVKVIGTSGGGGMHPVGVDIITPIHINDSSLKVGSLGLLDLRQDPEIESSSSKKKIDLSRAKAWLAYDSINNEILSSYNISAVVEVGAGDFIVYLKQPFKDENYVLTFGGDLDKIEISDGTRNKNSVRVFSKNPSDTKIDTSWTTMVFYGELENEEDIDLGDL